MNKYYYPEERIAIVAMGGYFPDADDVNAFWDNILKKKVSVREIPEDSLDPKIYYRPELFGKPGKSDKTYTRVGAVARLDNYLQLCRKYRIPPTVAEHMDPNQHVAIYCVDQALKSLKSVLPKERTAVIFGTGAQGKAYENVVRRVFYQKIEDYLRNKSNLGIKIDSDELQEIISGLSEEALKGTIPITEDSAPGMLQNIIAARITNVFDFCGPSYTVDAACASTLAATSVGVAGLLNGDFDAVITGASEVTLNELGFVAFSGINALSPDGSFPFDERANGFVIGLGGGVLILKRLSDAIRDQDNILALISGYGQGSDGKGKSIAAPSEEGQVRVIQDATRMAGYPVDTIELIEAHGTGTSVGDVVEISALKKAFLGLGATKQNYCGISSVKSNIGHLRYAAGAPSLIKTAFSLKNRILPPTANIKKINPKLQLESSPFYILTEQKNWQESKEHPRRAGVSSYGFGGADCHIAMEEYRPEFFKKVFSMSDTQKPQKSTVYMEKDSTCPQVVFFSGDSLDEIKTSFSEFINKQESKVSYENATFLNNSTVSAKKELRVAVGAGSVEELKEKWDLFIQFISEDKMENPAALQLKGIYFGKDKAIASDKIAWMFPGQASQYPNMLKGIHDIYPSVQSFYMQVDAMWNAKYGYPVTSLIFGNDEEQLQKVLKNTRNTHPAMFLSNIAMYKMLSESGVKADYMIGHSLGEITALYASGMLDLKSAVELVGTRGFSFDSIPESERGLMVSVKADKTKVDQMITDSKTQVSIANINSPEQVVVGGIDAEINRFVEFLSQNNIVHTVLKVSHAFHTNLTAGAADSFYNNISQVKFDTPKAKVMACHVVDFYPDTKEQLQELPGLLKNQILSSVNFVDSVRKLYDEGVRVFIEAGPSSVLTSIVKSILQDDDVKVIASNSRKKDDIETYQYALAELFTYGVDVCTPPSKNVLGLPQTEIVTAQKIRNVPEEIKPAITQSELIAQPVSTSKESLVYSGVSLGLPGSFKKVFSDDNLKLLLEGKNLIEMLTDDELQNMLDLNITRLIKTEEGSTYKRISTVNEVIQLAGKLGKIDLENDYLVDEKTIKQMTFAVCAGIAAGYEALKDAGIPLVQERIRTASGNYLPGRYVLPKEMQDDTGIIYANGFLMIEPFIEEVSKFVASKFGAKTRNDLINFYQDVISNVSDSSSKKILTDWFTLHYSRLYSNIGEEDIYQFNYEFMAQISSRANNRLAQFIGAMGPNFHISAACCSTASAVTLAEDLIRAGHARRMIIVGAENPSSKSALPWLGASFLSMGAATDSSNVFEAAVPFDNRRKGMILGSGAVGLVIEKESDIEKRGMKGLCRIMGTHIFNTAGHQVKIDSQRFSVELDRFLAKMEEEYKIDRKELVSKTVYYSHETYSPKKGGCSIAEKNALEQAFGEKYTELKVINTKGMTGHTMGASIEEAVAAKCLQYQEIPPIVNYREPDMELEGLNLSKGGSYKFEYVLRMVAGYGAQGNYHLLQKIAAGDNRVYDKNAYQDWLANVTSSKSATLKNRGRLLIAEGEGLSLENNRKDTFSYNPVTEETSAAIESSVSSQEIVQSPALKADSAVSTDVTEDILDIYSEVTKYPKEMLDLSMELEADLGIDTVKQATIFSMISSKFNLSQEESVKLSNYPTIGHVVNLIQQLVGVEDNIPTQKKPEIVKMDNSPKGTADCSSEVFEVISEITKYPVDMLDKDMEMEADLGIDTVKQATIFSILGEKYGISQQKTINVSQYRTIDSLIQFVHDNQSRDNVTINYGAQEGSTKQPDTNMDDKHLPAKTIEKEMKPVNTSDSIEQQVLELISEITRYPVEMLEKEMEMEADLGIDTVKQATIFSMLGDRFQIGREKVTNISQYRTIGAVINLIEESIKGESNELHEEKTSPDINSESDMTLKDSLTGLDNAETELSLQIPVFVEEGLGTQDFDIKGKSIWLIGDEEKTVQYVLKHFKKYSSRVKSFVFEKNLSSEELEVKITEFVKDTVDVIVDCTHLGTLLDFDRMSRDEEERMLFLSSEARFVFYKKLSELINEPEIRIVCVVSIDGYHGYSADVQPVNDPFYGALTGFYKGLRKEWSKSSVKIIDIGLNESSRISKDRLSSMVDEIQEKSLDYEIGYNDGKRNVLKIDTLDKGQCIDLSLPENPHFVITGGGNGITSHIIMGLCKRFKGKFTILGRTQLPENVEELSKLDESSLEQKKIDIHNELKAEGKKVTPAMVQYEFDKLIKAISVYRLMDYVIKAGGKVLYIPCDVRDYDNLKEALSKALNQNGDVHILVHAAGLERSRLIKQKTQDEFKEVFSVKAEGLCNLYRLVDTRELKAVIGFSSVSGRFGNEAQLDYCAANSFINSFMSMVKSKRRDIFALSIAWSGWKDTGMAWRNEFIKNHSEEMGLHLIEPGRGTEAFIDVLTNRTSTSEVIISKGLRHFVHNKMMVDLMNETPLLDWVTKKNGRFEKAYKILSVKTDPVIDQHRLGVTPIMPAVGFLEMGAEYHSINYGRKEQYCFKNINLNNALKLHHERPQELILSADKGVGDEGFAITFYTYLQSKFGVTKRIELNSFEVSGILGDYKSLLDIKNIENETMEQGYSKDGLDEYHRESPNSIQLGPIFMDGNRENNTYRRNKNGAVYSILLPEEQLTDTKYQLDKLLVNPAFMDSVLQACGVHTLLENNRVYLPWKIEELGVVKVPRQLCRYKAYSRVKNETDEFKTYDVIMFNENDELCYYAKDVVMRLINL